VGLVLGPTERHSVYTSSGTYQSLTLPEDPMSLCAPVPYDWRELVVDIDTMSGAQLMALSSSRVAEECRAQRAAAEKAAELLRSKLLENGAELLNVLLPTHDRTSCNDLTLSNKYGRCRRCTILSPDVSFSADIEVNYMKQGVL
jgi:hypothetical protein